MNNKKTYKIAILPGDGIGPETIREGYKILNVLKKNFNLPIKTQEYLIGGTAIDKYNSALPLNTLKGCQESDAILFGSIGGPKWDSLPSEQRPEKAALLPLRKKFNLFANLRPSKLYNNLKDLSPLRNKITSKGINILCVRELTGGIYFGESQNNITNNSEKYAFDTEIYYESEISRISHLAFQLAQKRNKKIVSVDKANILKSSILWRKTVNQISKKYPDVSLTHLYIDNAIMQIIKNPHHFDVILCSNLFGDIISDECAAIIGSIGMLPSASLNEKGFALYEPSGGSAPDIQNQNIANPIAQILSIAMLVEYTLKLPEIAKLIDNSVNEALNLGYRTLDISNFNNSKNYIKTNEMGDIISKILEKKA